jgi:pectate lyase
MKKLRLPFAALAVGALSSSLAGCGASSGDDLPDDEVALSTSQQALTVERSTLFRDLAGWGRGATGGLGGQVYVVTSAADPDTPTPGTLRYGVEVVGAAGPTWIVFDHVVFPPTTKKAIRLTRPLALTDNLTIDGRGSYVSIRKTYDYADVATWTRAGGGVECTAKTAGLKRDVGPIMRIRSKRNIILTHLDFFKEYVCTGENNCSLPTNGLPLDKQCFGDVISIYNLAGEQATRHFGDIWINQSNFQDCGDECIGVTKPSYGSSGLGRSYLTISRNQFTNNATYKAILLGMRDANTCGDADPSTAYQIAASFYLNRFVGVRSRQPRVENSIAHVYNNVLEDWTTSGVQAGYNSRVMAEQNVFRAVSQTTQPWIKDSCNTYLWARRNQMNVSAPPSSSGFPVCVQQGGPWYYDCSTPMIDVASLPWQSAIDLLRSFAGWKSVPNDVG